MNINQQVCGSNNLRTHARTQTHTHTHAHVHTKYIYVYLAWPFDVGTIGCGFRRCTELPFPSGSQNANCKFTGHPLSFILPCKKWNLRICCLTETSQSSRCRPQTTWRMIPLYTAYALCTLIQRNGTGWDPNCCHGGVQQAFDEASVKLVILMTLNRKSVCRGADFNRLKNCQMLYCLPPTLVFDQAHSSVLSAH